MTVQDLILELKKLDPDRVVVFNDTGTPFCTLVEGVDDNARYIHRWRSRGTVKYERLTPALKAQGFRREDCTRGGKPAVVLFAK
jgi:hypothetical protein